MSRVVPVHQQVPISVAIAILYSFFFHKLTSYVTKSHEVFDMCREQNVAGVLTSDGFQRDKGKSDECWRERDALMKKVDFKKHWMLLMFGLAGLVGSLTLFAAGPSQVGIGWGGVLCLVLAITCHWRKYNESEKLMIVGGSLAAVVMFSNRLFPH